MSKKDGSDSVVPEKKVAGLGVLGFHLDGVSWASLEEEHPALAGALADVVGEGYTPGQIRQYVMQRGLPVEWARWLEQAARYVAAGGSQP